MLHLEHGFVWCWNLDASGSISEIPGKFWNVVLEKDWEDQLDRSCEKWRSVRVNEQRNILHEIRKRKANWIGHILRRNCLLRQVIEGKIKGEMEVARRRKKLLDDLKDRRGYSHLKDLALDRTMWRNRFGGGFGPVVRQNTEWMNERILKGTLHEDLCTLWSYLKAFSGRFRCFWATYCTGETQTYVEVVVRRTPVTELVT